MTNAARRIAGPGMAVLAAAVLSVSACSSPVVCSCSAGFFAVTLPAAQTAPITGVQVDAPCTVMSRGSGTIHVVPNGEGICHVRVSLANGDIYTFSVEFRTLGCCPLSPVDASAPTRVDADL